MSRRSTKNNTDLNAFDVLMREHRRRAERNEEEVQVREGGRSVNLEFVIEAAINVVDRLRQQRNHPYYRPPQNINNHRRVQENHRRVQENRRRRDEPNFQHDRRYRDDRQSHSGSNKGFQNQRRYDQHRSNDRQRNESRRDNRIRGDNDRTIDFRSRDNHRQNNNPNNIDDDRRRNYSRRMNYNNNNFNNNNRRFR